MTTFLNIQVGLLSSPCDARREGGGVREAGEGGANANISSGFKIAREKKTST